MAAQKEIQICEKVLVVVDCIVFGFFDSEVKTLLVPGNRSNAWDVISDVVRNETLEETAQRMLCRLPGLQASHVEQLKVYTDSDRYDEDRVMTVAMCAIIRSDHPEPVTTEPGSRWLAFHEVPKMNDRFSSMFLEAKNKLKKVSSEISIMAPLLPQKFTIIHLQRIYESIHEIRFDKGNFSKRFFSANILKRLNEKNASTSKKGSFYYEFDVSSIPTDNPKPKRSYLNARN